MKGSQKSVDIRAILLWLKIRGALKNVILHFKRTVNGNGAISSTFEKYAPEVTTKGYGKLSWQAGSPGQNDGYWFINAGAHKLIMDSPLSFVGAEMLFTTLYY
ncbi:hypothetical protein IOM74_004282 [Salmonella enterica]|nr:hypothetical protein [Salmonella enterica]